MSDPSKLRPATPDEFVEALSFALRFKGRKPFAQAGSLMAQITAELPLSVFSDASRSSRLVMVPASRTTAGLLSATIRRVAGARLRRPQLFTANRVLTVASLAMLMKDMGLSPALAR